MAHPQFEDGEDSLMLWWVASNKLNMQKQTADMECAPAWRLGVVLTFHHKNKPVTKTSHWALNLVRFPNNVQQKLISIWKN
jgi:hypothetical protein